LRQEIQGTLEEHDSDPYRVKYFNRTARSIGRFVEQAGTQPAQDLDEKIVEKVRSEIRLARQWLDQVEGWLTGSE